MVTNCGVPYQIYVFDKDETAEFQEGWFDEMVAVLSTYVNNYYRGEFEEEEDISIDNIDQEMILGA